MRLTIIFLFISISNITFADIPSPVRPVAYSRIVNRTTTCITGVMLKMSPRLILTLVFCGCLCSEYNPL